jgi:hypothetical protein
MHSLSAQRKQLQTDQPDASASSLQKFLDVSRINQRYPFLHVSPDLETVAKESPTMDSLLTKISSVPAGPHTSRLQKLLEKRGMWEQVNGFDDSSSGRGGLTSSDPLSSADLPVDLADVDETLNAEIQVEISSEVVVPVSAIELGLWVDPHRFSVAWKTSNEAKVGFNRAIVSLGSSFSRHTIAYRLRNLTKELVEPIRYNSWWI